MNRLPISHDSSFTTSSGPAWRRRGFLAAALAWPVLGAQAAARAGLPIPLAGAEADPGVDPTGYLVSEKYDGARAVWDGQQLRFRSGGLVHAPQWFRAALPAVALDGELWMGRGRFEALSAAVRRHVPRDEEWRAIRYQVFDLPAAPGPLAARVRALGEALRAVPPGVAAAVEQRRFADRPALQRWFDQVVGAGGEGLVLRKADGPYAAGRDAGYLKLKPLADAEATVVATEPGKGRLQGRVGALRVRNEAGLEFRVGTGLDDALRARPPAVGERITYTYRGLTENGVPRFASFLRVRPPGV